MREEMTHFEYCLRNIQKHGSYTLFARVLGLPRSTQIEQGQFPSLSAIALGVSSVYQNPLAGVNIDNTRMKISPLKNVRYYLLSVKGKNPSGSKAWGQSPVEASQKDYRQGSGTESKRWESNIKGGHFIKRYVLPLLTHTVRAPIFQGTILSPNTSMETIPSRCMMRMIFSWALANCHLPSLSWYYAQARRHRTSTHQHWWLSL